MDALTTGEFNTCLGVDAGDELTEGNNNVLIGYQAGEFLTTTGNNTFIGFHAGENSTGSNNIYLGFETGENFTSGSGNLCLGYQAGPTATNTSSNLLFINNSQNDSPLIWGDFSNNRIVINGNSGDNTNNRTFFSNGAAGGTLDWYNDSDERLKKNIKTIENPLDKIMAMRGVNFEWKDTVYHASGMRMGFIAQETELIIPEVVDRPTDLEKGTYSMAYAPITALLIEGVKMQQEKIAELEEKIVGLQQKNTEQTKVIEILKTKNLESQTALSELEGLKKKIDLIQAQLSISLN